MKNDGRKDHRSRSRKIIKKLVDEKGLEPSTPHCESKKAILAKPLLWFWFPVPLLISGSLSGYDDSANLIIVGLFGNF